MELYPSGKQFFRKQLRSLSLEGDLGVVLDKYEQPGTELFVPERGGTKLWLAYRVSNSGVWSPWTFFAEMKGIKYGPLASSTHQAKNEPETVPVETVRDDLLDFGD
jgi:hypothetical protein